jgi:hypothetical protein
VDGAAGFLDQRAERGDRGVVSLKKLGVPLSGDRIVSLHRGDARSLEGRRAGKDAAG